MNPSFQRNFSKESGPRRLRNAYMMEERYKAVDMLGTLRCKNPDNCDSANFSKLCSHEDDVGHFLPHRFMGMRQIQRYFLPRNDITYSPYQLEVFSIFSILSIAGPLSFACIFWCQYGFWSMISCPLCQCYISVLAARGT